MKKILDARMPNRAKRWAFDRSVSMKTSKKSAKSAEEILQKPWKTPWKTHEVSDLPLR
jgi:hypothetical protein